MYIFGFICYTILAHYVRFFNYKGDIKMCGFLVVRSEEFELQVFQKALDKAAYRGPDYQHVSIDHGITWGFNRLSIMDL